jgi:hypothetical protein
MERYQPLLNREIFGLVNKKVMEASERFGAPRAKNYTLKLLVTLKEVG